MIKQELRKIYKQKRVDLSATERLKMDDLLLIQLQRLSFDSDVQVVMSFWPLENHGEMNTHLYTRYLELSIPDIKIAFPVVNSTAGEMHAILVNDETKFSKINMGLLNPAKAKKWRRLTST